MSLHSLERKLQLVNELFALRAKTKDQEKEIANLKSQVSVLHHNWKNGIEYPEFIDDFSLED